MAWALLRVLSAAELRLHSAGSRRAGRRDEGEAGLGRVRDSGATWDWDGEVGSSWSGWVGWGLVVG